MDRLLKDLVRAHDQFGGAEASAPLEGPSPGLAAWLAPAQKREPPQRRMRLTVGVRSGNCVHKHNM